MQALDLESEKLNVYYFPRRLPDGAVGGALIYEYADYIAGLNLNFLDSRRPHDDQIMERLSAAIEQEVKWENLTTTFIGSSSKFSVGNTVKTKFSFPNCPIDNPMAREEKLSYFHEDSPMPIPSVDEGAGNAQTILSELAFQLSKAQNGFPSKWLKEGPDAISSSDALKIITQLTLPEYKYY